MRRRVTLLALLAAFSPSVARSASASDISVLVSGRAGDVTCPAQADWLALLAANGQPATASGLTWVTAGRVRLAPWVCRALADGASSPALGAALNIVAHESAHLRGIRDEATAACWGLAWAADLARQFYGIEFFTPASRRVMESAVAVHRLLPPLYHTVCA